MKKERINKLEIKLMGISARTNNKNEMNPATAKIGELVGRFWGQNMANQIPNRKTPGITLAVYTNYDTDEHGDYTYFIGEEVNAFDNTPDEFQTLTIPASRYQKFTTLSGKMPTVVMDAWQKIWKMTPDDLGGKRAYQADFEIYDERAHNPERASADIYIGIE
jgi:predicted transcriptional regulator YdeE